MKNPNILRRLEFSFFKILVNNERVSTSTGHEYNTHHVYLVGFSKARLKLYSSSVKGEIEYTSEPKLSIDEDVFHAVVGREPEVKRSISEEYISRSKIFAGTSMPFILRIQEDGEYLVTVNNKHYMKGEKIGLEVIGGDSSILNLLIYPIKIMWIYMPRARFKLEDENGSLDIRISKP